MPCRSGFTRLLNCMNIVIFVYRLYFGGSPIDDGCHLWRGVYLVICNLGRTRQCGPGKFGRPHGNSAGGINPGDPQEQAMCTDNFDMASCEPRGKFSMLQDVQSPLYARSRWFTSFWNVGCGRGHENRFYIGKNKNIVSLTDWWGGDAERNINIQNHVLPEFDGKTAMSKDYWYPVKWVVKYI